MVVEHLGGPWDIYDECIAVKGLGWRKRIQLWIEVRRLGWPCRGRYILVLSVTTLGTTAFLRDLPVSER